MEQDPPALRRLERLGADAPARPAETGSMPQRVPVGQLLGSVVVPGAASLRRNPLLGVACLLAGVVAPIVLVVWALANRDRIIGFALDPQFLTLLTWLGVVTLVARLAAVGEVWYAHRTSRGIGGWAALALVIVAVLAIPVGALTLRANDARRIVGEVFADRDGPALFTPDDQVVDADGVSTILLLGTDAGPGRWGARTDTMILVSVDRSSGRAALVSVPRNLTRLRFPPGTPLADAFPDGFDDLANAVFTHVNTRPELVEYYGTSGLQPEAVALTGAIGYSLGIEIEDFALVNIKGFADVVDAIGGVTLELDRSVPLPPSLADEDPVPASIGPGVVELDGALAIAFARTRSADSDYQRMGRQRQLLAALGSQVSATEALSAFGTVTGALQDSMRTSLSSNGFDSLLNVLGDSGAIVESVGLTPPLIEPGRPDYDQIRSIIDAVQQAIETGTPSGFSN